MALNIALSVIIICAYTYGYTGIIPLIKSTAKEGKNIKLIMLLAFTAFSAIPLIAFYNQIFLSQETHSESLKYGYYVFSISILCFCFYKFALNLLTAIKLSNKHSAIIYSIIIILEALFLCLLIAHI